MDRIGSAKRKRESPDEDEVAEILETVDLTRKVVSQVYLISFDILELYRMRPKHAWCLRPLQGSWARNRGFYSLLAEEYESVHHDLPQLCPASELTRLQTWALLVCHGLPLPRLWGCIYPSVSQLRAWQPVCVLQP